MKKTFIYVKTHNITNIKYFGKTTRKNVEKYRGSGVYWKRHIKKHGYNCRTYVIRTFTNKQECIDFCLWFSKINNIVKSDKWANLINENGLDGGDTMSGKKRKKFTKEHRQNLSKSMSKAVKGINNPMYGKNHSEEAKQKMRKPKKRVICPHCNKIGGFNIMKRWHFDNCKVAKSKKNLIF